MTSKKGRMSALLTGVAGLAIAGGLAVSAASAAEVTYDRLKGAENEPQNWLTVHGNYSGTRHSKLSQINKSNVADMKLAFSVPLGGHQKSPFSGGTLQGTPLVNDGFMYVANGWGETFKIDVRSGRKGQILWVMDPGVDPSTADLPNNRGVALLGNMVYTGTLDGRMIGTDADTGEIVWERRVGTEPGESFTGAPLAVKDMVMVGQALGDWGTRGWLEAMNAETGESLWRTYTVPGPGEPGHETWQDDNEAWKTGGASLWVTGTYDPDMNITIWGTGNPVPMFDPEFRPGDNLYSDSAVAFDVDTGEIAWYFQYTPGDYLDYDEVGVHLLYDAEIDGETRKVVGHFGRNGFYYNLDRANGAYINGGQYVNEVTWTEGIDPKTGKPLGYDSSKALQEYIPGMAPRRGQPQIEACPHLQGGVNFFPTAYNPDTNMAYGAGFEGCFAVAPSGDQIEDPSSVVPGEIFLGGAWDVRKRVQGSISAVDVNTGETVAKHMMPIPNYGGVLSTGGGLIFAGWLDGTFGAYDSTNLSELWSINLGVGFKAPPITYSVDGQQYVAILGGSGGVILVPLQAPELENMQNSSMLFVFSL